MGGDTGQAQQAAPAGRPRTMDGGTSADQESVSSPVCATGLASTTIDGTGFGDDAAAAAPDAAGSAGAQSDDGSGMSKKPATRKSLERIRVTRDVVKVSFLVKYAVEVRVRTRAKARVVSMATPLPPSLLIPPPQP